MNYRAQLEEKCEVGSWQRVVFKEFQSTLLARERGAKKFPCIYATKGFRANDHRYIFLDSDNPSEPRNVKILGPAMRAYLEEARNLGPNTSLLIICGPSDKVGTVEDYNNRFWDFLRGLRILDTEQWPENVPVKTADEHWTFCFNGEPIFPIALTPAHEKRRSRYASNMMIAMQPKWVIDNLMSTTEKREHATKTVRSLLKEYDDIDISSDLSNYGAPGTTESKQLTLSDENESSECPYDDFDIC
jgi:FPC/CPF motif-containing protein YcgG